ncbi:MAG TPA: hypothetical protein VFO34_00650 [Candidatus Acidoferrales bacterium]|nr:hypothetical protein [Candidatus Acidoferrales bacterium]
MPSRKSSSSALVKAIRRELNNAGTRLSALLKTEAKLHKLLKNATAADKRAIAAQVKKLERKYRLIENLVDF